MRRNLPTAPVRSRGHAGGMSHAMRRRARLLAVIIPVFCAYPAEAIARASDILHVDVALSMQIAQDVLEASKCRLDILGFLVPGIGFIGNLDIEIEAIFSLFA